MKTFFSKNFLLFLILFFSPKISYSEKTEKIKPVVVEEKKDELSQSHTHFGRKYKLRDEDIKYKTLDEVIKDDPSIQIKSSGSILNRKSAFLRGTDAQQTLILLDGIPLNSPLGGGFDLSFLPLSPLYSVEIYHGGQSPLFGSDAIGGAILLETIDPFIDPSTDFLLGYGSFHTLLLSATHSEKIKNIGLVLSFSHAGGGGDFSYIDDNHRERKRKHNESFSDEGFLKLKIKGRKGMEWSFFSEGFFSDRNIAGLSEFPSLTAKEKDARALSSLMVRKKYSFFSNDIFKTNIFYKFIYFNYDDREPPMSSPIHTDAYIHTPGLKISYDLMIFNSHKIETFFDTNLQKGKIYRKGVEDRNPQRLSSSFAIKGDFNFFNGKFLLSPLLRGEWNGGFGIIPAPSLGLSYFVLNYIEMKTNIARSYRVPSFEELYFDGGFIKGNENLKPEDSLSFDAGFKIKKSFIELEGCYFGLLVKNLILFLPKSAFLTEATNSGGAIIHGFESEIKINLLKKIVLYGGWTFNYAFFKDTGMRLPHRSQNILKAKSIFNLKTLSVFFEMLYEDGFYLDRFEHLWEGERIIFNAGLSLLLTKNITTNITFYNIGNNKNMEDILQHPLPGFNAIGDLRVKL